MNGGNEQPNVGTVTAHQASNLDGGCCHWCGVFNFCSCDCRRKCLGCSPYPRIPVSHDDDLEWALNMLSGRYFNCDFWVNSFIRGIKPLFEVSSEFLWTKVLQSLKNLEIIKKWSK
ncbi:hypothetical protein CEXT_415861 [Caerostris extrusa]|uniref:Uncharacterized protein n=1 Tax=Caerostris extrusa TaxID=172846 RepID=A0AAV4XP69_CAEEX|nr:hypothetical protein CEXT_415861 [Caerostris extrusa]